MSMKSTPLRQEHEKLNAKMVDFAGWYMPVEYSGLRGEHDCVRKNVGLFDVSHMGEIRVQGPKALETLQFLTTNDVAKLNPGEAQYSLYPNAQGGIVDDLIVYCIEKNQEYLLCVNASNVDKDFEFMTKNNRGAEIVNESADWGQIAVQGPKAIELTARLLSNEVKNIAAFSFLPMKYKNSEVLVARTGYTGEDGFEIFVPKDLTVTMWQELLEKGKDLGVLPIGLGARDTLRTEMKYSLYGHEIDDESNPYEAGLGWVVKPGQKDFLGKDKIEAYKAQGLKRKLIGFKSLERGIPRQGYSLFSFDKKEIGKVTSGTMSPSLNEPIGIGYVDLNFSKEGQEIFIDIRGRMVKAKIVATPFVKTKGA
jgi:aminomethyltransferase